MKYSISFLAEQARQWTRVRGSEEYNIGFYEGFFFFRDTVPDSGVTLMDGTSRLKPPARDFGSDHAEEMCAEPLLVVLFLKYPVSHPL